MNILISLFKVNLFNDEQLVDVITGSIYEPIWMNQITCFTLSSSVTGEWTHYVFEESIARGWNTPGIYSVSTSGHSGRYIPIYGRYEIVGFVENKGDSHIDYVKIKAIAYNSSGQIVKCGEIGVYDLEAGQRESFKIEIRLVKENEIAHYNLISVGRND